ncbi:MAG: c-type cytochrome [Acidobacteriaceae bacterium]
MRLRSFLFTLPAIMLTGCATLQSTTNVHGPAAQRIGELSTALSVTFVLVTLVMWLLIWIAAKKNGGSLNEHMPVDAGGGQKWVAIGGLGVPLLVLTVFFFLGLELLADFPIHGVKGGMHAGAVMPKPDILIIGHQWWWEVHYLYGGTQQEFTTANEIHIPAHQYVNIELESADVLHSFWVPSLHGKVDVIPNHPNFLRVEASQAGNFVGQCAEYCGEEHARMRILVVAQEPAAFDAWLAKQRQPAAQPATPETQMGEQAFLSGPCSQCHTVRGTFASGRAGPDLTHIGSRKLIGANSFPNNNGYLEGWVTDAQSLKPDCKMPAIRQYSGPQLRALVAYLRGLQ